jgi:hypothetical protein
MKHQYASLAIVVIVAPTLPGCQCQSAVFQSDEILGMTHAEVVNRYGLPLVDSREFREYSDQRYYLLYQDPQGRRVAVFLTDGRVTSIDREPLK